MTTETDRTAAVIPTVLAAGHLERCLSSVLGQSEPFDRVIVVLDGVEGFWPGDPRVEVLTVDRRHGFAGAANQGLRAVLSGPRPATIAVLNDDVVLDAGWHRATLDALALDPEAGSCATVVLQAGQPDLVDSAGIEWLPGCLADNRGHGQTPPPVDPPVVEVWGASAAAAVYRGRLLDEVGLFDESFGSYQEDVDLAVRSRRGGWRCVLATGARAHHAGHASNRPFPLGGSWADYLNARNRIVLVAASVAGHEIRRSWPRIVRDHGRLVLRSRAEGRAAAVWAGFLHGLWRAGFRVARRLARRRHR